MALTKRISLYAHLLTWIGLLIYTIYFRLTYHLIDVPADYLMAQNRFWAMLNIVFTVLYALYIIGYGYMLFKRYMKWVLMINIILAIIVTLRAAFMAGLGHYVLFNIVAAVLFIYQIIFSYAAIKTAVK